MKIVLASGSPRRRELLSLITENFAVCPADADESLRDGAPLADEVVRLSRLKAEAAMQSHQDAVCIGSDTMVTIDRLPLGKPKDEQDAAEMLRRLRGRTHEVLTGLAVLSPDGRRADAVHPYRGYVPRLFRGGACGISRDRRAARQGGRLRHPGPRRAAHRGHLRRLLQRYGASGRAARRDAAEAERCTLRGDLFCAEEKA